MQSAPVIAQRSDHRYFGGSEFEREGVLFFDRRSIPATGAIELSNDRRSDRAIRAFDTYLIHTVFVTVECQQATIGNIADRFDRRTDEVRREMFERVRVWPIHCKGYSSQGAFIA